MPRYCAYGLTVDSELSLPEWPAAAAATGAVDLDIRLGPVPTRLEPIEGEGLAYQINSRQFLLSVDGVARYLVEDGRRITVAPASAVGDRELRLFLQTPCVGVVLRQRGLLVLHAASARRPRGKAVVLVGGCATGKSTLLAGLVQRGWGMLCDEIAAIEFADDGTPTVRPAYPRIRLWALSVRHLNIPFDGLARCRDGMDRFDWPVTEHFCAQATPIERVLLLTTDFLEPSERRIPAPLQRIRRLVQSQYHHTFVEDIGQAKTAFAQVARLARKVPIEALRIDRVRDDLASLVKRVTATDGSERELSESA